MTMTQTKLITGKVARVLNSREVALNRGANDGVEPGMVFRIISPAGFEVTDPDTGEVLGSVENVKFRVRVVSVQDRICVARTFKFKRINVGGNGFTRKKSSKLFDPPRWVKRYETLKSKDAAQNAGADEHVSIGDLAVQEPPIQRS